MACSDHMTSCKQTSLATYHYLMCWPRRFTPEKSVVAGFHFTIAILPGGPSLITAPPVWYKAEKLKTEKELEDEELKALLTKKLRDPKKKKKKAAGEEEGAAEEKEEA